MENFSNTDAVDVMAGNCSWLAPQFILKVLIYIFQPSTTTPQLKANRAMGLFSID
jgi:hypothetical protein